jgi:hypothetical protein
MHLSRYKTYIVICDEPFSSVKGGKKETGCRKTGSRRS